MSLRWRLASDWWFVFKLCVFPLSDPSVACYGPGGRWLGHTLTLFGQTRSVPMSHAAQILCCRSTDNTHQCHHQWHWIAQSSSHLRTVSWMENQVEKGKKTRLICSRRFAILERDQSAPERISHIRRTTYIDECLHEIDSVSLHLNYAHDDRMFKRRLQLVWQHSMVVRFGHSQSTWHSSRLNRNEARSAGRNWWMKITTDMPWLMRAN